jgi:hypothetical protein
MAARKERSGGGSGAGCAARLLPGPESRAGALGHSRGASGGTTRSSWRVSATRSDSGSAARRDSSTPVIPASSGSIAPSEAGRSARSGRPANRRDPLTSRAHRFASPPDDGARLAERREPGIRFRLRRRRVAGDGVARGGIQRSTSNLWFSSGSPISPRTRSDTRSGSCTTGRRRRSAGAR